MWFSMKNILKLWLYYYQLQQLIVKKIEIFESQLFLL